MKRETKAKRSAALDTDALLEYIAQLRKHERLVQETLGYRWGWDEALREVLKFAKRPAANRETK